MILKVLKDKEETYIDTHEQFYEEIEPETKYLIDGMLLFGKEIIEIVRKVLE